MYTHVGEDVTLLSSTIIAVIDLENTSISKETREFLKTAEKKEQITNVSDKLPKTAIICNDGRVFITNISSMTIKKRSEIDGKKL